MINRIIKKLISLNHTIAVGYNSISWLVYTTASTSLVSLVLASLGILTLIPAILIPAISIATYYVIGKAHKEHAPVSQEIR